MSWRPVALLPLILTLWACAEGGSRGSGITTIVTGNVATVETAASPGIEGIRVAIEGTAAHDKTDSAGDFSVRGSFEGLVQLIFQVPGSGQAQIAINVPAGGTLTLGNVALDTEQGTVSAETQGVYFVGVITGVDCSAATLALVSVHHAADDTDSYVLQLDTSTVRNAQGMTLSCEQIPTGAQATVEGMVNPDGTFGEATVDLQ
jgi:hypothetical protein